MTIRLFLRNLTSAVLRDTPAFSGQVKRAQLGKAAERHGDRQRNTTHKTRMGAEADTQQRRASTRI